MNFMQTFSKIMLGTVQFGMNYGVANTSGKPSFDTIKAILKEAYDHNVYALDTAPEYGDSEELIGKALSELGLAGRFSIVTKIPSIPDNCHPYDFMEKSLAASLKRLHADCVAAVLLHNEKDDIHIEALKMLRDKGMTERAGISLNTLACKDAGKEADCLQVPASLLDHRFDHCFGHYSRHCFVRGAFLQGMLLMPEENIFVKEVIPYRRQLQALGLPMAELALRYLFAKPAPCSVLTGVETLAQLQENIRIAEMPPLSENLLQKVDEIVSERLPEICVSPFFWKRYKEEHI